jgi:hypothetical protein
MNTAINPVEAARTILADRHKAFTVSTSNLFAICQALVDATDNPQPIITNELAEAARALIAAEATATMAKGPDGYAPLQVGLAREQAFLTFKTLFETEFPQ